MVAYGPQAIYLEIQPRKEKCKKGQVTSSAYMEPQATAAKGLLFSDYEYRL
jgi:hypothetical protein